MLDRVPARDEQRIDLAAQLPESFTRVETQATIRGSRATRRNADHFDRIDRRAGIVPAIDVRRARENLKRADQIENLRPRSGNKHDSSRRTRRVQIVDVDLAHEKSKLLLTGDKFLRRGIEHLLVILRTEVISLPFENRLW